MNPHNTARRPMAHRNEFIEYLLELLHDIDDIDARPMFGGYGLFHEGLMFALVTDDVLYFKTDKNNMADFEQRGLKAFSYERKGKQVFLSYNEAPGEALDDPDEMCAWARNSIAAAKRNRT